MQKPHIITFRTSDDLAQRWKRKVPKDGDRSHVLRQLLEMYVTGKIQVPQPQKP